MLKASGCLEVKEWELGDLTDTKSGQLLLLASEMGFFSTENDPLAYFQPFSPFFHAFMVQKKNLTFSQRVQKSSKLSENDIYIYLRSFLNYGAKQPSRKNVMRVQKFAFFNVKTEKTAKNRSRGHFQKKRTSLHWLIKARSYPDFVSLRSPNSHSITSKQPDAFNIWV